MSRILAVGSFDPEFPRNAQLLRLLRQAGHEVDVQAVPVWTRSRADDARRPRPLVAARAVAGLVRVGWRAAVARRPDLVLLMHPSQIDALIVHPIARVRRLPVLVDLFISMQDTVVDDRGLARAGTTVARAMGWLDRVTARAATLVLADTPQHATALAEMTECPSERFRVLWVGADPGLYQPRPPELATSRLVLFYGTFIPLHGTEVIVRASAALRDDDVRVRMIGEGQERSTAEQLIAELDAPVELVGQVPETMLIDEIARASICLGIFGGSAKASRVVPNKVFQCLAVGRPVITADSPAIREALGDAVERVPALDHEALASSIRGLLADPVRRRELATGGPVVMARAFGDDVLGERLASYVLEVLATRRARSRRRRG